MHYRRYRDTVISVNWPHGGTRRKGEREEKKQHIFFVSGMTGQVGGAAARQLLEEQHGMRTLAWDPLKAAA